MRRRIFLISSFAIMIVLPALSAMPNRFINQKLYGNTYPNTINQTIKPEKQDSNSITSAKGNSTSMKNVGKKRVIKRTTKARAAATNNIAKQQPDTTTSSRRVVARTNNNNARAATNRSTPVRATPQKSNRNVVARSATRNKQIRSTVRSTNSASSGYSTVNSTISSQRCFANYKECMETYCKREDTAYNRCYCSAKLAQIDAKYQSKIDELTQKIIRLQYSSQATSDEIKTYWDEKMKVYTGTNPWENIDNALNINWADTESRIRGQNAFNTGHQYCVNTLRACSSMATNMRDAYKSEITRDCATYESSLQKLQTAAESVIENYND